MDIKRPFSLSVFGLLVSCLCLRAAEPPERYWSTWRDRQRAELGQIAKPADPPAGSDAHPIDRFLAAYWSKQGFQAPPLVNDAAFARRAYLDIIGLPPTEAQLDEFQKSTDSDKRAKLVDKLLADNQGYTEHWISFWSDLLRNDEQTNIDGLRKPITKWLYNAILENKLLDLFTAELLNPGKDGPTAYLEGVLWRGRVNASQMPPVQAAQNVSQVFMATALKCASCHNHFTKTWKLADSYGLASFFAPKNLEMSRCDKPTGKIVPPKFLYPELGSVPADADELTRRQTIARMVTSPRNPRYAKTLVNRLWRKLVGEGLFEPIDDIDNKPFYPELLDWLAYDFMAHDYNAKHTIRLIMLSRIYQLPVVSDKDRKPGKGEITQPLRGPRPRRLTSEQYQDAIAQVTGHWPKVPTMDVTVANAKIRAWRHRKPDHLAIALGRPSREQVCSERSEEASVLQALELVNGKALTDHVREGAKSLLNSELGRDGDTLRVARRLYLRTLSHMPAPEEASIAQELLSKPSDKPENRQAGWEDFLWILFQGPEFQFVG